MLRMRPIFALIPLLAAMCLSTTTRAEIISISGSASAAIQSHDASGQTGSDQATKTYPDPDATLPLQVVARLAESDEQAAGAVAAQFADPLTAAGPNPEEFAINLTLNSLSPTAFYTAQARTTELRNVVIRPAEIGAGNGLVAQLTGRLFLDGVLAVFAVTDITDLTGVTITMRVTIAKEVENAAPQQVFTGTLTITGGSERQVNATVAGGFPTDGILDTDLAALDSELGVFRVFVLPNLVLDYPYQATVGQPFALRATIAIEAANRPAGVGLAAILGTPIETIQEVINATRGAAAAETMLSAIGDERAHPQGTPTFPEPARPVFPLCGLFGVESLLGILGLVALRTARVIK